MFRHSDITFREKTVILLKEKAHLSPCEATVTLVLERGVTLGLYNVNNS